MDSERQSFETIIVFITGELIGLPFCFAGTDALMSHNYFNAGLGFGIGIPIAVFGLTFFYWKRFLTSETRISILRHAVRWWPLAFMGAFIFIIGPDIYRRAIASPPPPPQVQVNAVQTSPDPGINSLKSQLDAANKALSSTTEDLQVAENTISANSERLPKSQILGLDDADRWRLLAQLRQGIPMATSCQAYVGMDAEDKSPENQRGIEIWSEVGQVIYQAGFEFFGATTRTFFPEGITIFSPTDSGPVFNCGAQVAALLQGLNVPHVQLLTDQSSAALSICKRQCIEIAVGKMPD